eukprot:131418_1
MSDKEEELPQYADVSNKHTPIDGTQVENNKNINETNQTITDTAKHTKSDDQNPSNNITEVEYTCCGNSCTERKYCICCNCWQWHISLRFYLIIGVILAPIIIIGWFEGITSLQKVNEYKENSDKYPFEIQCLITDKQSIKSTDYVCYNGYNEEPLYSDYVYYEPQCSIINEQFSDTKQFSIFVGDNCENTSGDEDAGFVESAEIGSLIPCYSNNDCSSITFNDYINWKSYEIFGALWLTGWIVSICICCPWGYYEYHKDKNEAEQCCRTALCCPFCVPGCPKGKIVNETNV